MVVTSKLIFIIFPCPFRFIWPFRFINNNTQITKTILCIINSYAKATIYLDNPVILEITETGIELFFKIFNFCNNFSFDIPASK